MSNDVDNAARKRRRLGEWFPDNEAHLVRYRNEVAAKAHERGLGIVLAQAVGHGLETVPLDPEEYIDPVPDVERVVGVSPVPVET